jgi:hypothetical protein
LTENKKFIDFTIEKVIGIDIEQEDKSVGIFGNCYTLVLKDKDQQLQLNFSDDEFSQLLDKVEPFIIKRNLEKEYEEKRKGDDNND